ncbi:ABC transporter substrate-binding protein [Cognatiyoonia sp. IB215182]|uniref:ABC transporter substrate-binding protein n=1 Tax=Cognatiyoonia sp. IB215182 TaxID=3097353 RepID=UPI002A0C6489|nr:ABC transporter substrate-binding protein [Cognatiyoonia sp. IB215182]MDX8354751.1 ABC transporter substrate-binding protein [Cognatiyoonia sp. IB215182]
MTDRNSVFLGVLAISAATPLAALDCETGFRPFEHRMGVTCVPETPQRIVTLHSMNLAYPIMELGVTPVGSANWYKEDGSIQWFLPEDYDTTEIAPLGFFRDVDVEEVAALNPDLIVGYLGNDDGFDRFAEIAPAVNLDLFNRPIKEVLFDIADLVNRTDEAERLEAAFNGQAAQIRAEASDDIARTTVSFIQHVNRDDQFFPVTMSFGLPVIIDELGIRRSPAEQGIGAEREFRSIEALGDHVADVIINYVPDMQPDGSSENHDTLMSWPVTQFLPAVQEGQIYPVHIFKVGSLSWRSLSTGLEQIGTILSDPALNRELVEE